MRSFLLLFVLLISAACFAQGSTPIPERIVSISCENRAVEDVLHDASTQAHFEFSWSSSVFDATRKVSLHVNNISVRRLLYLLFGNTVTYKVHGNYMILLAAPEPVPLAADPHPRKAEYVLSGYTLNAVTGEVLPFVSVYDSLSLNSALSDQYGHYSLKLDGGTKALRLKVSHENYRDTFLLLTPSSNTVQDISLYPVPLPFLTAIADTFPQRHDSLALIPEEKKVEHYKFLDSLIGFESVMQSRNLKDFYKRGGQVALVPFVSSNGKLSGNVVNHFSLNIIAGYSGGTNGAEIGGMLNIDRRDVKWVQIAGMGNVVGGKVSGFQGAGAFNIDLGSVHGVQACGGSNVIFDTLWGAQLAGGSNLIRGGIYGLQLAGGSNIVRRDMDGFQLAAGANITFGTVNKVQGCGGMNYAGNMRGLQAAGGANITLHLVTGWQLAGGLNYAGHVRGGQISAGGNVTLDTLTGVQISGGFNYSKRMYGAQIGSLNFAREVNGAQVGVINFADTCSGGAIVGVLSFVRKGVHELEIASSERGYVSASFRTGTPRFYNILQFGMAPDFSSLSTWSLGYGIGHRFILTKHFDLAADAIACHVNRDYFSEYVNEWGLLQVTFEWRPSPRFALAAGPVFNYYVTNAPENDMADFQQKLVVDKFDSPNIRESAWFGGKIALRFF